MGPTTKCIGVPMHVQLSKHDDFTMCARGKIVRPTFLNCRVLRIPTLAPEIEPKPSRAASRTRRCVSEMSAKWKQTVFGRGVGYSANLTTARAITPSLPILKAFLVNRDAIWS